jgi:hypothetical protein|nr:hypothetical protein Q903MT_gene4555 [Picea sitchensis]
MLPLIGQLALGKQSQLLVLDSLLELQLEDKYLALMQVK